MFEEHYGYFIDNFPEHKNMVLSTSCKDKVTSRMMSIIRIGDKFYFQADCESRKAQQIKFNKNVSLWIDNIQIDGVCECVGSVGDNIVFCSLFSKHCNAAYQLYSFLDNEMLYVVTPVRIQRWVYENNQPFVEVFDCAERFYEKREYLVK